MNRAEQLAPFYRDFDVQNRVLLSGHSHQAWPDVAKQGLLACYADAASHVDDKWTAAFEQAEKVKDFYRNLMGEPTGEITLAQSTHELILRFLSDLKCFKQRKKSPIKIVTTDGEFHSMRRQLARLQELDIMVESVPTIPTSTLAARLIEKMDSNTDAVMVSAVFFATSEIFFEVGDVAAAANSLKIPCLVDSYHSLNVIPFNLKTWQLETAFIVGGGYKYCQAGEGNCFMRIPAHYDGSPIITGWFAEFDVLDQVPGKVGYGKGHAAFSGSTYDPSSHYRAAAVFDFFKEQNLNDEVLAEINTKQIEYLWRGITSMRSRGKVLSMPKHDISSNAGFLSLTTSNASEWVKKLAHHNIQTDSRGDQLRLGPAPYVSRTQLDTALNIIEDILQSQSN